MTTLNCSILPPGDSPVNPLPPKKLQATSPSFVPKPFSFVTTRVNIRDQEGSSPFFPTCLLVKQPDLKPTVTLPKSPLMHSKHPSLRCTDSVISRGSPWCCFQMVKAGGVDKSLAISTHRFLPLLAEARFQQMLKFLYNFR